jgi:hypothetical protein
MGKVVPMCGAGSLIKIVVRESMSQGHGCASWHVESTSSQ